jgi:hypothetical protein
MYNLQQLICIKISRNSQRDDVSSMNNIYSDVVVDTQTQARAGKCIIHCFYGNHLIEMQIPVFGVKKKACLFLWWRYGKYWVKLSACSKLQNIAGYMI